MKKNNIGEKIGDWQEVVCFGEVEKILSKDENKKKKIKKPFIPLSPVK